MKLRVYRVLRRAQHVARWRTPDTSTKYHAIWQHHHGSGHEHVKVNYSQYYSNEILTVTYSNWKRGVHQEATISVVRKSYRFLGFTIWTALTKGEIKMMERGADGVTERATYRPNYWERGACITLFNRGARLADTKDEEVVASGHLQAA